MAQVHKTEKGREIRCMGIALNGDPIFHIRVGQRDERGWVTTLAGLEDVLAKIRQLDPEERARAKRKRRR